MVQKHNPGKIIYQNKLPKWQTQVDDFNLKLDIIALKKDFAIASFVVMEQNQNFLDHAGRILAEALNKNTSQNRKILLITAESKGSHFVPWVWNNLNKMRKLLYLRTITLRKGKPKVYMQRPAVCKNRKIKLPKVVFSSITSPQKQTLTISPKDLELLISARRNSEFVFIDDFIGSGGTIAAVKSLFSKLSLTPPKIAAVIGSDGEMYKKTFKKKKVKITLLPETFCLKLPTFTKEKSSNVWKINKQ